MNVRRSLFHRIELLVLLLCFATLSACALLQPSADQAWSDSMGRVTATRSLAAQALNQSKITRDEGASVLKSTDQARALLDDAGRLLKTDKLAAKQKVDQADQIVNPVYDRLKKLFST